MGVNLSDVPDRYDVVFQLNDGTRYGFLLADSVESNLPFRTHKALYSYSPTFLERQNVSQQYGDNFQDFFLTGSQDDFSLGEQQKFFRVNDAQRSRRYFKGSNVDPSTIPGNVALTPGITGLTHSFSAACPSSPANNKGLSLSNAWWATDATNIYSISSAGVITSHGAHGYPAAPSALEVDGFSVYMSGTSLTNSGGIRAYNINGNSFSTYSSSVSATYAQLCYTNNILFGYSQWTDSLYSFDSSGNPTVQFSWLNPDGSTDLPGANSLTRLVPYGGSIFMARLGQRGAELWTYDGSGCRLLARFVPNFTLGDIAVSNGVVFVSGYTQANVAGSGTPYRPQIYFYSNGSLGKMWESQAVATTTPTAPPLDGFQDGLIFQDPVTKNVLLYDMALGGVHTVASFATNKTHLYACNLIASAALGLDIASTTQEIFGLNNNYNSTGYIQTSQYDFDNTLPKVIRGLKVDADIPANTSIDLAYQLDGCGGTYTTLQTGVTSGTEYLLPASTSAHSISVQVTLNSATGSATPTLKRVYVRAAPTLQQFRRREFLFDLSGGLREEIGKSARRNRDNTPYPYDPKTAANNLRTIATQTIPFTVQDRFDQFTCIADLQENSEGYDGFAIYEIRPDVFIGRINLREV